MKTYKTSRNKKVTIAHFIDQGGEGVIYGIHEMSDVVAKIYCDLHKAKEQEKKLQIMIANPPQDETRNFSPPHVSIAWPIDILYEKKNFVGFLMPYLKHSDNIVGMYNPLIRANKYPFVNWIYLHHIAKNLATLFFALHARGYLVGDVNQKNILVNQNALITLIDTDSFQISENNNIYRCPVGTPDYTPPELQGKDFKTVDRFSHHDCFGLAVIIFQLLMEGTHPFTGAPTDPTFSIPGQIFLHCIEHGIFPYRPNSRFKPPPSAPRFDALLPDLQKLFLRCFIDGHQNPSVRPTAREWLDTLDKAEKLLIQCRYDSSHFYSSHRKQCHWCERKAQKKLPIQQPLFLPNVHLRVLPPSPPLPSNSVPPSLQAGGQNQGLHTSNGDIQIKYLAGGLAVFLFIVFLIAFMQPDQKNVEKKENEERIPKESCGDLKKNLTEQCDGSDLGGMLCNKIGFSDGNLTCNSQCRLDTTQCFIKPIENMAFIANGSFLMGCVDKALCVQRELPRHTVYLDAFYIDRTEVTVDAYARCVRAGACKEPNTTHESCSQKYTEVNNWGKKGRGMHPVNCVSWYDAVAYCRWMNKRLPTEAEWEKAARSQSDHVYPWGNEAPTCDRAVLKNSEVKGCGTGGTMPVGSKPPGANGLYDMAGNVWEWTADWYDEGYYGNSPYQNPMGPGSGTWRVNRGGSLSAPAIELRVSLRSQSPPTLVGTALGFRCAK